MNKKLRKLIRDLSRQFGYAILDLRKDQATDILLPGHLKKIIEQRGINCVVDVGANRGQFGTMLRGIGYAGKIVSIEPVTDVYIELNKLALRDPNWITLNIALGDEEGLKRLNVFASRDLSSFLSPTDDIGDALLNCEIEASTSVVVKTLDSIIDSVIEGVAHPHVLLKLDTQGYDIEVLKGAKQALKYVRAIQSEISIIALYREMPDYIQALGFFDRLGFAPTGFFAINGHRKTGRILEYDVVLTRLEGQDTPESPRVSR